MHAVAPENPEWLRIPLVYCSVSDPLYTLSELHNPFTGVDCRIPIDRNLELIKHLLPTTEHIIWVERPFAASERALEAVRAALPNIMPDARLEIVTPNVHNTDSIFDYMTSIHENTVFLTYSWRVSRQYSRYALSDLRMDFQAYSFSPMFSLTPQPYEDWSFCIGGYYLPLEEIAEELSSSIEAILSGQTVTTLPLVRITEGANVLNYDPVSRANLLESARSLEDARFTAVPPSFWDRYLSEMLAILVLFVGVSAAIALWVRTYMQNMRLRGSYNRYKKLFDSLRIIYKYSNISFAVYDADGRQVFSILSDTLPNGKKTHPLLPHDMSADGCFTREEKRRIVGGKRVTKEVKLTTDGRCSTDDDTRRCDVFRIEVCPIENSVRKEKFLVFVLDVTQIHRTAGERDVLADFLRFASEEGEVGIASFRYSTQHGEATPQWGKILGESLIVDKQPAYKCVASPYREELLAWRAEHDGRTEGKCGVYDKDVVVVMDGVRHWVRVCMFINAADPDMVISLVMNQDVQKADELALQDALARAEQSNNEKKEFLNSINHEVRTPLNSIVGFASILALIDEDSDEYAGLKDLILRNNRLLLMLIDNIIDLSEIESGKRTFTVEPIDVEAFYQEMVNWGYLQLYDKQLDIIFQPHEDTVIYTDRKYLERMGMHVLSNAIKFTDTGSVVVGIDRTPDKRYYLCYIEDTGHGIPPENLDKVFKPFYKVDSYRQGTGLGLTLCRSIATHLGGSISIESTLGKGTRVCVKLPVPPDV
jgi:nitrogen-specific signal transduction histidine kinase